MLCEAFKGVPMSKRITITLGDGVHDELEKAAQRLGKETAVLCRELMEERMRELGILTKLMTEEKKEEK
jgi:predicted DNA-binding protein